jgi:hypothetical protein
VTAAATQRRVGASSIGLEVAEADSEMRIGLRVHAQLGVGAAARGQRQLVQQLEHAGRIDFAESEQTRIAREPPCVSLGMPDTPAARAGAAVAARRPAHFLFSSTHEERYCSPV